ncbi:acyltransferase family protein [Chryseobacterium sp. Leaf405]|uniref:acyltransferase family protein n=1 Tax=Chryseobacterium sp. Leaf405 TaxID=1736367 RepID=UPI00161E7D1C|nr:acyltransferase [Chryseobacterium sp. Leaf405]
MVTPDKNSGTLNQLIYIDTIKVLLTILVVLHHTFIAYSSSDGWYYNEPTSVKGAKMVMTMFVSVNQSFFMGFFFLLAAYFTGSSYAKKGFAKFVKDRLVRLGIPILFYSFILTPFMCYLVYYFGKGNHIGIREYLSGYNSWVDLGVTWFIAALLVFTLIYVILKRFFKIAFNKPVMVPGMSAILWFSVGLGIITFLVRIIFPVGWVLKPVGFQLGHFPQYIALFVVGLLAAKNNWFDQLSYKVGRQLKRSAVICLLFFPVFLVIAIKLNTPISYFSGGFHWQALIYALWEQWIGISIITALLIKGKKSLNKSSRLSRRLSRSSFAVYIFHPLVIVLITLSLKNWQIDSAIKILFAVPIIVMFSFLIGLLLVLIPGTKKII